MTSNMAFPSELTSQLKAGDEVVSFVELKYGWIALTNERIIYQARVLYRDGEKYSHQIQTNNFPISKITNIGVRKVTTKAACCLKKKFNVVQINMQGSIYELDAGKGIDAVQPLIREFNARS